MGGSQAGSAPKLAEKKRARVSDGSAGDGSPPYKRAKLDSNPTRLTPLDYARIDKMAERAARDLVHEHYAVQLQKIGDQVRLLKDRLREKGAIESVD